MEMMGKFCLDCGGELEQTSKDGIEYYCRCSRCGARWCITWDDEENWIMGFQCDNGSRDRNVHDHGRRLINNKLF